MSARRPPEKATAQAARQNSSRRLGSLQSEKLRLLNMSGDQFGHLEHADTLLPVENRLEAFVGIDHRFLLLVLQTVLANIPPQLLGQLRPRQRRRADNFGKLLVWLNRLHKSRAGFPL